MEEDRSRTLQIMVDGERHTISIGGNAMEDALPVFARMNVDLDRGGMLGPHFIDNPGPVERCQIVGDRLLTALHNAQQPMAELMAAYILFTLGDVASAELDTNGEIAESMFYDSQGRTIRR